MTPDPTNEDPAIDPLARIHLGAAVGDDVTICAFSVVGAHARIGDQCRLAEHAVIRPHVVLGPRCRIDSFAVIGGDPQDLGFDTGLRSRVEIGADVVVRESVTIHRSTKEGGATVVGDGVFIMAGGHIAHDCQVGSRVILANNVLLAGHVQVGPDVMLGGGAGVHQFSRVGEGAMIAGNSTATLDVPPFTMIVGRNGLAGLNLVGLRRRGISVEDIADLKKCYRTVYRGGDDPRPRAEEAIASGECGKSAVGRIFLEFFAGGTRGFARPRRSHRGDSPQR